MRRLLFVLPILAFAGLAALFWKGLSGPPPSTLPSPLIGRPAPGIALPPLDAAVHGFDRADLAAGHPTLVNFWASWCAPCREEHPLLMALAAEKGIALYGVAYKDTPDKARAYLDDLGNPFARVDADMVGRVSIDWGVTGVPETFVVDGAGIVRAHYAGALTQEVLARVILPALGK